MREIKQIEQEQMIVREQNAEELSATPGRVYIATFRVYSV
jgi:hypothetical protein